MYLRIYPDFCALYRDFRDFRDFRDSVDREFFLRLDLTRYLFCGAAASSTHRVVGVLLLVSASGDRVSADATRRLFSCAVCPNVMNALEREILPPDINQPHSFIVVCCSSPGFHDHSHRPDR